MYTTFFDVGDKVYHNSYGSGKIVEMDDTVSPPRYEIVFDRYPNKKITVVGHNDLVLPIEPEILAKKLFSGLNEDLVRSLNKKLSSNKAAKEVKDSKEKKDTATKSEKEEVSQKMYVSKKDIDTKKKEHLQNLNKVVSCGDVKPEPNEISAPYGFHPVKKYDGVAHHFDIVMGLNKLYAQKNADYGDSFHETFKEEGMAMARIRLSDKLNRFKSLTRGNSQQVADESIRDTLLDLANYAIMTVIEMDREADTKAGA